VRVGLQEQKRQALFDFDMAYDAYKRRILQG
jgi:hypothetical protein